MGSQVARIRMGVVGAVDLPRNFVSLWWVLDGEIVQGAGGLEVAPGVVRVTGNNLPNL